jgi:hypothetical protein
MTATRALAVRGAVAIASIKTMMNQHWKRVAVRAKPYSSNGMMNQAAYAVAYGILNIATLVIAY